MKKRKVHIMHGCNGGEKSIGCYRLDGFDEKNKTIYDFLGDFWHRNPKIYPPGKMNPRTGCTFEKLFKKPKYKRKYFESLGFKYTSEWEDDFRNEMKQGVNISNLVTSLEISERLNPRSSYFGGRVNATCLHYKTQVGEKVKYVDFTSLYPSVQKQMPYPVGYPEIITSDFKDITEYFGLVKCKIVPPRKLFHPVLPSKMNGKLMFPLCRKCVEINQKQTCKHNDYDRALTGVWCTPEIKVALKKRLSYY